MNLQNLKDAFKSRAAAFSLAAATLFSPAALAQNHVASAGIRTTAWTPAAAKSSSENETKNEKPSAAARVRQLTFTPGSSVNEIQAAIVGNSDEAGHFVYLNFVDETDDFGLNQASFSKAIAAEVAERYEGAQITVIDLVVRNKQGEKDKNYIALLKDYYQYNSLGPQGAKLEGSPKMPYGVMFGKRENLPGSHRLLDYCTLQGMRELTQQEPDPQKRSALQEQLYQRNILFMQHAMMAHGARWEKNLNAAIYDERGEGKDFEAAQKKAAILSFDNSNVAIVVSGNDELFEYVHSAARASMRFYMPNIVLIRGDGEPGVVQVYTSGLPADNLRNARAGDPNLKTALMKAIESSYAHNLNERFFKPYNMPMAGNASSAPLSIAQKPAP